MYFGMNIKQLRSFSEGLFGKSLKNRNEKQNDRFRSLVCLWSNILLNICCAQQMFLYHEKSNILLSLDTSAAVKMHRMVVGVEQCF